MGALAGAGLDLPEPIQRVQLLRAAAAPAPTSAPRSPGGPGTWQPAMPTGAQEPPRAVSDAPRTPDIAVDTSLQDQVDDEARTQADQNLLRPDAPRE
jgi:hypothetical protein